MKAFTDLDKRLAKGIDKQFKWIGRDRNDDLWVYDAKPHRNRMKEWDVDRGECMSIFIGHALKLNLFEPIRWDDEEPTLISDIYNSTAQPVLTDLEREYLKAVFKPFRNDIDYVRLRFYGKTADGQPCHISAYLRNDNLAVPYRWLDFPSFIYHEDGMYSGMVPYHDYTLEALGIYYS